MLGVVSRDRERVNEGDKAVHAGHGGCAEGNHREVVARGKLRHSLLHGGVGTVDFVEDDGETVRPTVPLHDVVVVLEFGNRVHVRGVRDEQYRGVAVGEHGGQRVETLVARDIVDL